MLALLHPGYHQGSLHEKAPTLGPLGGVYMRRTPLRSSVKYVLRMCKDLFNKDV